MNKVLKLIEGKWDCFMWSGKVCCDGIGIVPIDNEGLPKRNRYSLNDFSNNRSVIDAIGELTTLFNDDLRLKMLNFLYDNPNNAEGLEKLILEWIEE